MADAAVQSTNIDASIKKKSGEDVSLRYRGLSYLLAVEIDYYTDKYFTWDLPVPFGNLQLYPVNVKDYNEFMDAISCFLLDKKKFEKNTSPKEMKKQLKMTDLEFMLSKLSDDGWKRRFANLIRLVCHVESGLKCPHCGHIMSKDEVRTSFQAALAKLVKEAQEGEESSDEKSQINLPAIIARLGQEKEANGGESPVKIVCSQCGGDGLYDTVRYELNQETQKLEMYIDTQKIDFKDFDRLRNIVLFQNLPDYRDTSYVDPTLKKDYEEQRRIRGQKTANYEASLEKKLAAMRVFYGLPDYEGLYKLTVRKFLIEFSMIDDFLNYNIGRIGQVCGLTGGPKEVKHWIYEEIKDVYADGGYVSQDTMMDRVKGVS